MNALAKRMMVLLVAVLCTACSASKPRAPWVNYADAMSKVRAAKTSKGMPRAKIFYHFRLYGVPSGRSPVGGWGGYASSAEVWSIPDGCTLAASKHWRYRPIAPKNASSEAGLPTLMAIASGVKLPSPEVDEKFYHEPRLEPYFDTLILTDRNEKVVGRIDLPYR